MNRKEFKSNILSVTSITSLLASFNRFVKTIVFILAMYLSTATQVYAQAPLGELISKIDLILLGQSEQDIRNWLDARITESGEFGVYPWIGSSLNIKGDTAFLNLSRGAFADAAAQFFRAYEMLGDKKYLEAGLKTANFFMAVQQPAGHIPRRAKVFKDGRVIGATDVTARMQDGYQFRPFALWMYAYKLTGDKKYFQSAKKLADFVTQRLQNPEWGWCADEFNTSIEGDVTKQIEAHGTFGVRGGGSYNDAGTTDGFRMSIIMYHATGEKKYLERSAKVGKWILATQLGKGKTRGWADSYNSNNEPVVQRNFEGLDIEPRVFNRFVGPLLTWFYAITGEEKYAKLFKESYLFMKDQEQPDGWAAEYSYDGHASWTQQYKTYRYDQPDTWPDTIMHVGVKDGKPAYGRGKVQLDDSKIIYDLLQKNGRKALTQWYQAPVKYNPEQYLDARIEAARRCTDERMNVRLYSLDTKEPFDGNFLERVRLRLAEPYSKILPERDWMGRSGLVLQSWIGPHTWVEPYRPSYGWASWQYVWDARLALGLTDPNTAASGGRGMENMHYWPTWDVMGDWTTRCIEVADWMDLPQFEGKTKK